MVDCADTNCTFDPACTGAGTPTGEASCTDGVDNDTDGLIDCADSDCANNCAVLWVPVSSVTVVMVWIMTAMEPPTVVKPFAPLTLLVLPVVVDKVVLE